MRRSKQLLFMFLVFVMPLAPREASWGQTVIHTQFNLSTPGARSLGMGGAFLALADDATAAYTNPAGLTSLTEGGPQVAVEFRSWDYSTPFIAEGRLNGETEIFGLDAGSELLMDEAQSRVSDLSFASLGYVLPRGLTFAVYKNQLANYSTSFESEGYFFDATQQAALGLPFFDDDGVGTPTWRTAPTAFFTEVKVDSLGAAIAYEVRRPFHSKSERPLSVGLGVTHYRLSSATGILAFKFSSLDAGVDGVFGRSQFLPADIFVGLGEVGDDSAIGFNHGFLWKLGKQRAWSIGGVYREGPKFKTRVVRDELIQVEDEEVVLFESTSEGSLKIPDVYGIGIAYSPPRSEGRTKIALDYQNIRYSQRRNDFFFSGRPNPDYHISDSHEVHLGVERVVVTSGSFVGTARIGGWRESAHGLAYKGADSAQRVLYSSGQDSTHWAAGLGLVIGESYQIDAAVDHSDGSKIFSFSVVRFF